jgi:MinD-like ATPase involved in chromosome partitioning or flagellar assembly
VTVPVLTAVTGAPWEAGLVAGLERTPSGLQVVRRCVDLPDLLAVAATGTVRAALVAAHLRRLDRDTVARLAASGVAAVGLHDPGDDQAGARLRALGVAHVLPGDAAPADVAAAVAAAVSALSGPGTAAGSTGWSVPPHGRPAPNGSSPNGSSPNGSPNGSSPNGSSPNGSSPNGSAAWHDAPEAGPEADRSPGRVVAVWGPAGAPGRTSVAVTVAAELAALGTTALLADADVYGGAVAQVLGLLDEAPGLAAAARAAGNGTLDASALAAVAPFASPGLRVLTGISRAERWPELRPAAVERVWDVARDVAGITLVDCAFCLEQDEELAFDTAAPRRNGVTLATLVAADVVLAVGSADPVGMHRLVRGLAELREVVPGVTPRVVLNRVRSSVVGPDPRRQLSEALERYAGVSDPVLVPDDPAAFDAALLQGRPVGEVAAGSAARRALEHLAADLVGRAPRRRRRLARSR